MSKFLLTNNSFIRNSLEKIWKYYSTLHFVQNSVYSLYLNIKYMKWIGDLHVKHSVDCNKYIIYSFALRSTYIMSLFAKNELEALMAFSMRKEKFEKKCNIFSESKFVVSVRKKINAEFYSWNKRKNCWIAKNVAFFFWIENAPILAKRRYV